MRSTELQYQRTQLHSSPLLALDPSARISLFTFHTQCAAKAKPRFAALQLCSFAMTIYGRAVGGSERVRVVKQLAVTSAAGGATVLQSF
jgi:hypothetical protein